MPEESCASKQYGTAAGFLLWVFFNVKSTSAAQSQFSVALSIVNIWIRTHCQNPLEIMTEGGNRARGYIGTSLPS